VALSAAVIASFLTPFMSSSVNIALPAIGSALSLDAVLLGWTATSYLLAAAMFLVPFGRLADILGRKRLLAAGLYASSGAALASALAPSALVLILFRVVHGIGSALMYSTALAILSSVFAPGRRGAALGIAAAATYLGLSLGPVLGGLLTEQFGWRAIFLAAVPVGLAGGILVQAGLKREWAEARGERFDWAGSLVFAAALPVFIYGLSRLPSLPGVFLVGGGLLGLGVFLVWESRAASPIFQVRLLLGNRAFAFSNLAALINYSATYAVGFLMSLYLQYIKGMSPQTAGLLLIAQPVVMAVFSPLAGRLSDRIEARLLASIGMGLSAVGLAGFAFLGRQTSSGFIVAALAVLGFGFALFSSPNTNAVMSSVEPRFYGVASATLATMRLLGQMLSMVASVLLFTLLIGQVKITPPVYGAFLASLRLGFGLFTALCLAGVFASLARGRVHAKRRPG
jgi:EmrB/QacA subfamily drug resistance transporter